jgi:hypothetical protein
MEWPPATGMPACAHTDAPPASTARIVSTESAFTGMPTTASAKIGLAPMA